MRQRKAVASKALKASAFAVSNVGKLREKNEDNFYLASKIVNMKTVFSHGIAPSPQFVCCVCDGMGGAFAGELASKRAVETIRNREKHLLRAQLSPAQTQEVIFEANRRVCDEQEKRRAKMGSTIVLFGFQNGAVSIANLGDSRAYCYVDNKLSQLTTDHTQAQLMVRAGVMSAQQAAHARESHALTQYLGIDTAQMLIEPEFRNFQAQKGDLYLLCSDGLYDMVSDAQIAAVLAQHKALPDTANALVQAALDNGGMDNITVIVIQIH
ncbi:MAG: serine/threonine-protein phosphatase [Clostridia bacterium]|nr:serine/threonine-protein phosphatase [Clostridia bacterium]